ncbi:MAG: tetratricopeptide repeat protein [Bacteroidota bacterium]
MKKHYTVSVFTLLLLGLFTLPVLAQDVDALLLEAKEKLVAGENSNDQNQIMEARAMFERATADEGRRALAHYYMGLAGYRLAGMNPEKDAQLKHLNASIKQLEKAIKIDEDFVEGIALLGSVIGWKSGLKPMQAMFLGPKATKLVARANALAPDNPRVRLVSAISDYNTPKMFGGDPAQGMLGFQQAADLFAKEEVADPVMPDWGHAEAYAWLGQGHMANGASEQARAAFEKALELNPDYGWVKHVLLPKVADASQ